MYTYTCVYIYIYIYIHTHLFITFPSDIPAPVLPPRLFAARGRSRGFSSRGLAGAAPPAARSEVEDLNFFFVVFIKHFFCISFLLRGWGPAGVRASTRLGRRAESCRHARRVSRLLHWCAQLRPCLEGLGNLLKTHRDGDILIVIINRQRGIPSKRKSSACTDYVPAPCTPADPLDMLYYDITCYTIS